MRLLVISLLLSVLVAVPEVLSQSLSLQHSDAIVWSVEQKVRGTVSGAASGMVLVGSQVYPFQADGGMFEVAVVLEDSVSSVSACTSDGSTCSSAITWTLGYEPRPEVLLEAESEGNEITLRARVLDNPTGETLLFEWSADDANPSPVALTIVSDSVATVAIGAGSKGEYYFNVDVRAGDGSPRRARTFVTVDSSSVQPFDIARDHAAWIDSVTLYEIAPWYFARNCTDKFACIEAKLEEIASLGIGAIWLQPTFPSVGGGQAYDVTDYFGVWSVLGDEDGLRSLIQRAKELGLKVLLDFVPNHTSIQHPYAQDAVRRGETSHYWDFYMREGDGAPYGNHYRQKTVGEMTFVYYFWEDLVTLNFNHEETRRHIIEASRYWIEEFDIDGYRVDAVWAPHARNPDFMHEWRLAMKRVKPEILLLAEDKATGSTALPDGFPSIFENFDVAYDWTDLGWCISEWAWARPNTCDYYPVAYGYTGPKQTLFNFGLDRFKANALRTALTNRGRGYHEDAVILRFLENNDTPRFIAHHSLDQTRMAAGLLFSLPGVPMLYYGQESGMMTNYPTIHATRTIQSYDQNGLWPFYRHLIALRSSMPALNNRSFEEVDLISESRVGQTFAYRRWDDGRNVLAVINLGENVSTVLLDLPVDALDFDFDASGDIYLTDLLTGDFTVTDRAGLATLSLEMPGHRAMVFAIADSVITVDLPSVSTEPGETAATVFTLHSNYPNPFTGETTVVFDLPAASLVSYEVFDLLGRRVLNGRSELLPAGRRELRLNAGALTSGVYLLRVRAGDAVQSRQITVVR
jgi:cyclomaltodextrinase / maltogenic alpha-amylase / neopullulanase